MSPEDNTFAFADDEIARFRPHAGHPEAIGR
jgi:hypothetical protein